jgi:hypothetical protein
MSESHSMSNPWELKFLFPVLVCMYGRLARLEQGEATVQ